MTKVEYRQHWQGFTDGQILVDGVEAAVVTRRKTDKRLTGMREGYFVVGDGFDFGSRTIKECGFSNPEAAVLAFLEHIGLLAFTEYGEE